MQGRGLEQDIRFTDLNSFLVALLSVILGFRHNLGNSYTNSRNSKDGVG